MQLFRGKLHVTSFHPKSRNMWSSDRDTQRPLPFFRRLTITLSKAIFIPDVSKGPRRVGGIPELKAKNSDIKLVTANQMFRTRTIMGQDKRAIFPGPPAPHHFQKASHRLVHSLQLTVTHPVAN